MRNITLLLLALIVIGTAAGYGVPAETIGLKENAAQSINPDLVAPDHFVYMGAFRLPGDSFRPQTFAYGGQAMTFNPVGDPAGPADGFPGSLYIMGHNRMPYGELPDGNQVAEISIPRPVIANTVGELNQAQFIQPFHNIAAGFFPTLDEIPRVGIEYLDTPATGPLIHLTWGQHFQEDPSSNVASQAWFNPDLSAPNLQGTWYIGNQTPYSVNDYLFKIPADWADQHTGGRPLATGRYRDGGWSGMGPALFAYRPWVDDAGSPAAPNTRLQEIVLLLYENSRNTENIDRCMDGYQHPDEWTGGAWITDDTGNSAVLFAGTKSIGDRYWYGFINPRGPQYPCIESAYLGQFPLCRLANGTPCPDESSAACADHTSDRGWWSSRFNARFILYDPDDLAAVAAGSLEPWEPQPYAFLDIDQYLFLNPDGVELEMLGTGLQRRYRLGDIAYDRENGLLYVLELFADEAKPVVHVWQIQAGRDSYTITVAANPPEGGTVSGSDSYVHGEEVRVAAAPSSGYRFVNWVEGSAMVSMNREYTFTANRDRNLAANFRLENDRSEILFASFATGTFPFAGGIWGARIAQGAAQALAIAEDGTLYGSFANGVFPYAGGVWGARIAEGAAQALVIAEDGTLYGSFANGVFLYAGGVWGARIAEGAAQALVIAEDGTLYGSFANGVFPYAGGVWGARIAQGTAQALAIDANGVIYGSFASGIFPYAGGVWGTRIAQGTAQALTIDADGVIYGSFASGTYPYADGAWGARIAQGAAGALVVGGD